MEQELIRIREDINRAIQLGNSRGLKSTLLRIDALLIDLNTDIELVVCSEFMVSNDELHCKLRNANYVLARQVVTWYDITYSKLLEEDAAKRFGQKRSTAYHSRAVIDERIVMDKSFRERVERIINKLNN